MGAEPASPTVTGLRPQRTRAAPPAAPGLEPAAIVRTATAIYPVIVADGCFDALGDGLPGCRPDGPGLRRLGYCGRPAFRASRAQAALEAVGVSDCTRVPYPGRRRTQDACHGRDSSTTGSSDSASNGPTSSSASAAAWSRTWPGSRPRRACAASTSCTCRPRSWPWPMPRSAARRASTTRGERT